MSERELFAVEKVTLYQCGAFGGQAIELAELRAVVVSRSTGDELVLRVRKPRARKWEGYRASDPKASFVVVRGWDAPTPPSGMVREGNIERSRFACFDPRYRAEFDAFVDRELMGAGLLGDFRRMTPERLAALVTGVRAAS